MKQLIKKIIYALPLLRSAYVRYLVKSGDVTTWDALRMDEAVRVMTDRPIPAHVKVGLVSDVYSILSEGLVNCRAYSPKYERFLKNNRVRYEFYDITAHDWMERAKQFDVIIWHTASDPVTQSCAESKIYVLDKLMGKVCLPSFDEIWSYENKINAHYLYQFHNLPEIPTFVTFDKKDALAFARETAYPVISKLTTGSAAHGVEKINSERECVRLIDNVFSATGRKTYWPFCRQKGYVYFQQFIEDATFDLRIIVIGNKLLGYYRLPKKGDFRASGAGIYEKKDIPEAALDLAYRVKEAFKSRCLATDLLYSEKRHQYYIIESSVFIGVDTCEQLVVDGVPGYYEKTPDGYVFREGRYWIQELTLKELFDKEVSV